jgi:hypothetical protein
MIVLDVTLESMPVIIKNYDEEHETTWPALKRGAFVLWDDITTTFSCESSTFELNMELSDAGAHLFSESKSDSTLTTSHPTRVVSISLMLSGD